MNARAQSQVQSSSAPSFTSASVGIIQRKCACGNSAGLSGECAECQKEKMVGKNAPLVQPKLKIGQPNDKYEQEADRVADEVMRMPKPSVQRQIDPVEEEEEEETIQTKPLATNKISPFVQRQVLYEEEDQTIQTKLSAETPPAVSPAIQSQIQGINWSSGNPLPNDLRGFMEPRFGHDFSAIRIHADGLASRSAHALNARAFTIGDHIVFNSSEYNPNTNATRRLIAHELTHYIQQQGDQDSSEIRRAPAKRPSPDRSPNCNDALVPKLANKISFDGTMLFVHHKDGTCARTAAVSGKYTVESFEAAEKLIVENAKAKGIELKTKKEINEFFKIMKSSERLEIIKVLKGASSRQKNGPIPDGSFLIEPARSNPDLDDSQAVGLGCAEVKPIPSGRQAVTRPENQACWGKLRIKITDARGVEKIPVKASEGEGKLSSRNAFYIHGGTDPMTSGCVKILDDTFLQGIAAIPHKVPFDVSKREPSIKGVQRKSIEREFLEFLDTGLSDWAGHIKFSTGQTINLSGKIKVENFDATDPDADTSSATVLFAYTYKLRRGTIVNGLAKGIVRGDTMFMNTREEFPDRFVDGKADFEYVVGNIMSGQWKDADSNHGSWTLIHP